MSGLVRRLVRLRLAKRRSWMDPSLFFARSSPSSPPGLPSPAREPSPTRSAPSSAPSAPSVPMHALSPPRLPAFPPWQPPFPVYWPPYPPPYPSPYHSPFPMPYHPPHPPLSRSYSYSSASTSAPVRRVSASERRPDSPPSPHERPPSRRSSGIDSMIAPLPTISSDEDELGAAIVQFVSVCCYILC
jgi:hypothetical protein